MISEDSESSLQPEALSLGALFACGPAGRGSGARRGKQETKALRLDIWDRLGSRGAASLRGEGEDTARR